ncbi:MAG: tetratricopeptide repeat protein [Acidobacteriota bacterium]|nr:tetratricopeptide repeat protein [Acidobacteriota bacterium]
MTFSRFARCVAALIWAICCVGAGAQIPAQAQQHFLSARKAQEAGDYGRATAEYRAAAKLEPTLTPAYVNLGLVEYVRQNYDASIAALEKARTLQPEVRGISLYLGMSYEKLHQPFRALPLLQQAAAAEPRSKEALKGLADALWKTGHLRAAVQTLRAAASFYPRDAGVLFLLGDAYRKAAASGWEDIVRKDPDSEFAHLILAETYTAMDQPLKAQRHFELAAQKNPSRLEVPQTPDSPLPVLESKAKEVEDAVAADPARLEARYSLGKIYKLLAVATLRRLLDLDDHSALAHELLARTYEAEGRGEAALAEYKQAALTDPALPEVHFAMGHLLWTLNRSDEAVEALQQELRVNAYHAEASAEIGTIFVSRHEPAKGMPYLLSALRIEPDLVEAHRQLGKAYHEEGRNSRALEELTRAIPGDKDGSTHYLLATVLRDMRLPDEARKAFAVSQRMKAERLETVNEKF